MDIDYQNPNNMKMKVLLTTVLAFVLLSTQAQFRKVPMEATNAFKEKYASATNVSWRSGLTTHKAQFELNGVKYTAEFKNTGEWIKTEGVLTYDKLPSEVSDGFHKSLYSGWERQELIQIDTKDKGTEYRIKVKKSDIGKKYLFFNPQGQLVKEAITI
jgi:hypothetical protein